MSTSSLSYLVWGFICAAGLVLWGLSHARKAGVACPSDVVGRMVRHPVLRVCLVLSFMWFGWHLFAR